jgi:hypothetical protein
VLRREPLRDHARQEVGGLADREAEQDAHRLRGIGLRLRHGGQDKSQTGE